MDLENELRQAMAEHVTGVSAPRTLAHEARRRHHRTVRRRTTIAVTAAGIVVAIAMVPTYQAIRPQPVGAPGPGGRHGGGVTTDASASAQPSTPTGGRSGGPAKGPSGTSRPEPPASRRPGSHRGLHGTVRALLGYVPPGIRPDETCRTDQAGGRKTTTCRWTGSAGWIEVRLVRDRTLTGPADMGFAPPMPKHVQVNGHAALRGDGPAALSQIMWIERGGLGVWVGVSPELSGRLMRVAESVRVS